MTVLEGTSIVKAREELEIWRIEAQLAVAPATDTVILDVMRQDPDGNEVSLWTDNPGNRPTFAIGSKEVVVEEDDIDIVRLPKNWKLRGVIVQTDATAAMLTLQVATRKWA